LLTANRGTKNQKQLTRKRRKGVISALQRGSSFSLLNWFTQTTIGVNELSKGTSQKNKDRRGGGIENASKVKTYGTVPPDGVNSIKGVCAKLPKINKLTENFGGSKEKERKTNNGGGKGREIFHGNRGKGEKKVSRVFIVEVLGKKSGGALNRAGSLSLIF